MRLDDERRIAICNSGEALKGIPLIEPDIETLYMVANRALHEAENIQTEKRICFRTIMNNRINKLRFFRLSCG